VKRSRRNGLRIGASTSNKTNTGASGVARRVTSTKIARPCIPDAAPTARSWAHTAISKMKSAHSHTTKLESPEDQNKRFNNGTTSSPHLVTRWIWTRMADGTANLRRGVMLQGSGHLVPYCTITKVWALLVWALPGSTYANLPYIVWYLPRMAWAF